jgi:hypothetical protein
MHEEFRLYAQKLWELVKDRPELWEQTFPMVDFGPLIDDPETPTTPTNGNTWGSGVQKRFRDAKYLYERGGEPVNKLAALGLTYRLGDDEPARSAPLNLLEVKHKMMHLPSNKQLKALMGAHAPGSETYEKAKAMLDERRAWLDGRGWWRLKQKS